MSSVSGLDPDERLVHQHRSIINDMKSIKVNVRTLDNILLENKFNRTIDFIWLQWGGACI